jgi:hypothetical protein
VSKVSAAEEKRLLKAVRESRRQISAAKAQQQEAVAAALSAEISPTVIAAELGVSKARVYQIRDGR